MSEAMDCDYLVIGAGTAGMAFTDALLAHSDAGLTRLDHSLAQGQRVRILSGPLADFTATIVRLDARRRVDVLLEIMGSAVSVSVDRSALAPAA